MQLTDLEVIQQSSLAVLGATASRVDVIAALEADLAWWSANGRARAVRPAPAPPPFASARASKA